MNFLTIELPIPEAPEPAEVCEVCGGPGVSLGSLGSREYFRCRHCGNQWSAGEEDHSYEVSFKV